MTHDPRHRLLEVPKHAKRHQPPCDLPMTRQHDLGTYQMLWDCAYCGAAKLLALDHRHCPSCGGAQDPERRYFPSDEDKVAVEDHQFVGGDWQCAACESPNATGADFCVNCGAGREEDASVRHRADRGAAQGEAFASDSVEQAKKEAQDHRRADRETAASRRPASKQITVRGSSRSDA